MLRLDGWRVNFKRVHRLWKHEGFKVPRKKYIKRRLGHSANGIMRRRAEHIRSDNGGKFIAKAITRLAEIARMQMLYIAPGCLIFTMSRTATPRAYIRGCVRSCSTPRCSPTCARPRRWRQRGATSTTTDVRTRRWAPFPRRSTRPGSSSRRRRWPALQPGQRRTSSPLCSTIDSHEVWYEK